MIQLTLSGHDDRYAVEQLLLSLFPEGAQVQAFSALHRGQTWLTSTAKITLDGRTVSASRRIRAAEETVRLRRRALQQSVYLAAVQLPPRACLGCPGRGSPHQADHQVPFGGRNTQKRRKAPEGCLFRHTPAATSGGGLLCLHR